MKRWVAGWPALKSCCLAGNCCLAAALKIVFTARLSRPANKSAFGDGAPDWLIIRFLLATLPIQRRKYTCWRGAEPVTFGSSFQTRARRPLRGHSKAANKGHLKTGQREQESGTLIESACIPRMGTRNATFATVFVVVPRIGFSDDASDA